MKRILFAAVLVAVLVVVGCDTDKRTPLAPRTSVSVTVGAYLSTIEYEGRTVKAWVVNDRNAPNGVRVIMVLDYPCHFIGPMPVGHGADCTDDPDGTPSTEPPTPPTARHIGDPTADD